MSSSPATTRTGIRLFEDIIGADEPEDVTAPTPADDIAFWLYTSGSTGNPKGAVHVHGSLKLTADLYGTPMAGLKESDVVYSVAKLFFAYGLGNALTFPFVGRRHHGAQSRAADAGRRRGFAAQTPGHHVLRRADLLCRAFSTARARRKSRK